MSEVAADGVEIPVTDHGQRWLIGWFPPGDPPPGTPHGAAAVCFAGAEVVLVSQDNLAWSIPGGRPEPEENWADTLHREVREEACAAVTGSTLLGFSRGTCVRGPQEGTRLVRSMWRADVRLEEWLPRFEMSHRKLVGPAEAVAEVVLAEPDMGPIYRRLFREAVMPHDGA